MPIGSNQIRCPSCGRHFNSARDLYAHQRECLAAQQSGAIHEPLENPRPEGEDRDWVSAP